jgi:hypothetical protein
MCAPLRQIHDVDEPLTVMKVAIVRAVVPQPQAVELAYGAVGPLDGAQGWCGGDAPDSVGATHGKATVPMRISAIGDPDEPVSGIRVSRKSITAHGTGPDDRRIVAYTVLRQVLDEERRAYREIGAAEIERSVAPKKKADDTCLTQPQ